ncbi:electron transfer flavoprotein-ubiquinone oxidoreductase [Candidatus Kinetoplastidibacterium crithidiae]|uniref:Electron transfer flavoprotein-ubiquinone oxidoreductase n=1 Tax=Candidatus Kinetoplastidibacterium crithidiae TCC036E TaxID=1208918 RepID=M1LWZ9_9PROT|nr:electron transfer flavoprotein-ubiquinone oxidoreductase [Candidatus Kinetoplastibacterium crithidii]AFZ82609.1 electron transfer flavoprotein-ubiquinone oxidoreductase [Candidatus Kinetoplastibacterium crithidii (ex Angomonas deanei ATCC 30255)]AGF47729.1 electron-transferring-flavoprotein dehydrogenase [Candidatus Kinetoplastibacterium crithidii TCC036E]
MSENDTINYDIVIVGGGPAGIATAIHLKQLSKKKNKELNICIIEKSAELGSHIISGAIIDIRSLEELFPDYNIANNNILSPVLNESFFYLTKNRSFKISNILIPKCLTNSNCYIVRLGHLVRWLGGKAEELGVDIFTGFTAKNILYNKNKEVCGIKTGDFGIDKYGQKSNIFQEGLKIQAKYTILAEGSRGHLGKEIIKKFKLDSLKNSQTYSIGIKENWEIESKDYSQGDVIHTIGWPLNQKASGGAFLYYLEKNILSIGMVIDLDYRNTWFSPFDEFQNYKSHKLISNILKGGKRLSYGARSITNGGLLSLPKISFPGGLLVGCEAGFLNSSRLKGVHTAIKSGMLAAETIMDSYLSSKQSINNDLIQYNSLFKKSWLHKELYLSRNFKLWNKKPKLIGCMMSFTEQMLLKEKFKFDLKNHKEDNACLNDKKNSKYIKYPKPDNILTFDKESSVQLSNTHHQKNQPIHLKIINQNIPIKTNLIQYGAPEVRYCPAGVYKFEKDNNNKFNFVIEAENCIHCKTCDIKDPTQNIIWTPPQGGEGPIYDGM